MCGGADVMEWSSTVSWFIWYNFFICIYIYIIHQKKIHYTYLYILYTILDTYKHSNMRGPGKSRTQAVDQQLLFFRVQFHKILRANSWIPRHLQHIEGSRVSLDSMIAVLQLRDIHHYSAFLFLGIWQSQSPFCKLLSGSRYHAADRSLWCASGPKVDSGENVLDYRMPLAIMLRNYISIAVPQGDKHRTTVIVRV